MSIRRAPLRAASAGLAVASVLLLATCDIATLTKPNDGTTPGNPFDSTEGLGLLGTTTVGTAVTMPLGGTATMSVSSASVSLENVVKRYSATGGFITVDSLTGAMTGVSIGTSKVTATILAPELGSGVTISRQVRVRYNGLRFTTPLVTDTIKGLGLAQNKTANVVGTNFAGANGLAVTADSLRSRDTTVFRITGTTVSGRKTGTAYLVAYFDGLRDSVLVRVRQVAKTITFPTADYAARHMNFNLTVPIATVTDITDSVIQPASRVMRWKTKDTTAATVDSLTGVLRVKKVTGDTIFAKMDTIERKQRIVVSQVPASLQKFAGDAQTAAVATNVVTAPTVTVLDSGATAIVGATVVFRPVLGVNAVIADTQQVSDANGRAKPTSWKLGTVIGANSMTANVGTLSTTFTATAVAGPAKKLVFIVNPTSASVNVAISPSVSVQVQDSLGNLVTTGTPTITLALGNNPGAAALAGTLAVAASNGVATFSNLSLNAAGSGYTLQATSAGLTAGVSNGFDIFGTATKLGFTTQPINTSQGATMANVRVAIQDAAGNTVGNSTANVTLSFSANPGSSTLGGTLTVQAVAGVATFSDLTVNNSGNSYTFQAASTGLTGATSTAFNVAVVGAAAKLAFSVQPSAGTAGATITPSVKVQVLDANGGLVTNSSQQITLAIESTSPSGGTLSGTLPKNAVNGEATFSDLSINKSGNAFKLLASAPGTSLTTATSTAFNLAPGIANRLGFVQQPTHTIVSTTMAPAVTVEVQDAAGNRVTTGATFSVTLALGGCAGATLTGGGAQTTSSGVATFSGLSVATQTTGCTLTASATGLTTSPNSAAFSIVAANGATRLSFTTEPSATATAGVALATSPVVNIQDATGNNVTAPTSIIINLSILSGPQAGFTTGGGNSAATTTNALFSNIRWNVAGTYRILATATGYRPDTSAAIVIGPAAASKWGVLTQPSSATAGVQLSPAFQVAVQDQFGNTVPGSTNALSIYGFQANGPCCIRFNKGPSLSSDSSQSTGTASNGILTFTGLSVKTALKNLVICDANAGALGGFCTSQFDITPGPVSKLGFSVQPPYDTVGTVLNPAIQVAGQDSVGNTVTDFSNAITVALTGGTSSATLGGTKTVAPAAGTGISSFSNLTVDRVGAPYRLTASATGVTTATSNEFNIDPHFLTQCCFHSDDMVVVGSTVYFVGTSNTIRSVPLAGGTVTIVQASQNAYRIATNGTDVFWAEKGTTNNGDAFIKKLTVSTGAISTLTVGLVGLFENDRSKMYADGVNVYFIAYKQGGGAYAIKSIGVNLVGGTPVDVFTNNTFASPPFALSGGLIYFYDNVAGAIMRMTTAGGSLTTLSTGSVNPERFAMSGTTLVFTDGVAVKSIPNATTAGGPVTPTLRATATGTVYDILADATNTYINSDGVLRRYQTSNFATFTDLVVDNGNLTANMSEWYYSFTTDGTNIVFFTNFGRLAKVPK